MSDRVTRREALKTAALAVGSAAIGSGTCLAQARGGPSRSAKPNIIFILADDLGYGDLGCYGQAQIQTPQIDQLAAEGVRFTDCYSGSTVCAPSRCCLMTGHHTGHARIRSNVRRPLQPEDTTVAQVLKQAGYATGIVGKWGLGEPDTTGVPTRQGFDEWFGYLNQTHAHNYYPEYLWRNEMRVPLSGNLAGRKSQYSHDLFTAEAVDFIQRQREQPFFLYLAYTLPHANNELGRETGNGMEVPHDRPYAGRPWPQPQKNHAEMITRLDYDVGLVMDTLRETGIDKNTIVLFTSDNGPHREGGARPGFFNSAGGLRGIKRDLYEGGIRVPMIARWPGQIAPGTTCQEPWAFWDFLPTAAELAGAQAPPAIDGVSVVPALLGNQMQARGYLYWEFIYGKRLRQAVRMGKWKAVRLAPEAPIELYDLAADRAETTDLAAENAELVARARELMQTARTRCEYYPEPG